MNFRKLALISTNRLWNFPSTFFLGDAVFLTSRQNLPKRFAKGSFSAEDSLKYWTNLLGISLKKSERISKTSSEVVWRAFSKFCTSDLPNEKLSGSRKKGMLEKKKEKLTAV